MSYTYDYPRPAVSVDSVVFRIEENDSLSVLLIQRKFPPYQYCWALPGGFLDMDETLEQSAVRELEEETGLRQVKLIQLKAYDSIGRDPRHRTITVAFVGFVEKGNDKVNASDDAAKAEWHDVNSLPELGFDHAEIMKDALELVGRE